MNVILIYLHLAVLFFVGALLCNFESKVATTLGVLNATFAVVCAYGYAIYNLWAVMTK